MDMLHSPVDVGAGEDGSDDKKDGGSLLQPVPWESFLFKAALMNFNDFMS